MTVLRPPLLRLKSQIILFHITITYLRAIAAGKINPTETAAVAPVNWKASQILGTKLAPTKINPMRAAVTAKNLRLSNAMGMA